MFCFVCGKLGYSDRDCAVVYANPDKEVERAYGVWLRAPGKNAKVQNIGSRWIRNGGQSWQQGGSSGGQGGGGVEARFREKEGVVSVISGKTDAVSVINQIDRDSVDHGGIQNSNQMDILEEAGDMELNERILLDNKRKRINMDLNVENNGLDKSNKDGLIGSGSKNGPEAGPVFQARLDQ